MITVHYLENSRAHRLLWLLEELELAYEIKLYRRTSDLLAPSGLKKIHPLGKSPVITDDDGAPLAESGAIFEYLLARYGKGRLVPDPSGPDWPNYLYFLHSAEGSAMPLLVDKLAFGEMKRRAPWVVRPIAGAIADKLTEIMVDRTLPALMDYWEHALGSTGYFAGAFSAADVMMSFPVQGAAARAEAKSGRPNIAAFLARIAGRPAYHRALEKGAFKLL